MASWPSDYALVAICWFPDYVESNFRKNEIINIRTESQLIHSQFEFSTMTQYVYFLPKWFYFYFYFFSSDEAWKSLQNAKCARLYLYVCWFFVWQKCPSNGNTHRINVRAVAKWNHLINYIVFMREKLSSIFLSLRFYYQVFFAPCFFCYFSIFFTTSSRICIIAV